MTRRLPIVVHAALAVLASAATFAPSRGLAQESRLVNVRADSAVVRRVDGVEVVELIGAELREGTTTVRAERMVERGNNMLYFYRNVRIIEEADTLTADEVLYDRGTKVGRATGNVRLSDGDVVVTAPAGDYDTNVKRADFRDGVRMVDSVSVLTSAAGSYWSDEKRAEFFGSVKLLSRESDVRADSLSFRRETEESTAYGRVIIERRDPTRAGRRTLIAGDRAQNRERDGTGYVSGSVLIARIDADSTGTPTDTLLIAAGRVWSVRTDSLERLSASDSVVVWRKDLSARSDSIAHETIEGASHTRLFGAPIAWVRLAQVSGDSLRVVGSGGQIDSLLVRGRAFVVQRDTVLDRLQQMRGRRLVGLFRNDSLRSLAVLPNAEAIYYLRNDEEARGGAVRITADRIVFRIAGDEITDIRVFSGIEGTYYPEARIPDPLALDGLRWQPDRRPGDTLLLGRFLAAECRMADSECTPPVRDP